MKAMEWTTTDKSKWGRGEWLHEPDKKQWTDATGLPCLIVRNRGGALCGYVGVAREHPWHGKDYSDDAVDVEIHGGLTFASGCSDLSETAYELMRARILGAETREEAKHYPSGDAAQRIREWGAALAAYKTWLEKARASFICHLPEVGEPDDVWWFGFDCAHLGDFTPAYDFNRGGRGWDGTYKNIAYVERECRRLAKQLAAVTA